MRWRVLIVPFAQSRSSALLTHGVSLLPFWRTSPKRSFVPLAANWPIDLAVRHLHRRDVERGRQVDDEPVDLAVLERLHRGVVRVVDLGRRARLDQVDDVVVARRPDLGTQLVLLEAVDRSHRRDRLALAADDRLVHEVVRLREVHRLRALRVVRDLRDVEVERLLAGAEGVVERGHRPLDLRLREAELLRDRVGDGGLVALAAVRVADLPRLRLLGAAEPGRERRVVGADRQRRGVEQAELVLRAAGNRRRRGSGRRRGGAAGRCCHDDQGGGDGEACDERFAHGASPLLDPSKRGRAYHIESHYFTFDS